MAMMQSVKDAIRHGLFTQRILERLRGIGIDLNPYLLFSEGPGARNMQWPELGEEFPSQLLQPEDVADVAAYSWATEAQLQQRLAKGHLCVLTRHQGRVAGYTWADLREVNDAACDFPLGPGEAYLYDAFVAPEHRGRGLAPYLRYQCYEQLRRAGYDTFYSVSDYFNSPAIRFKRKLNAQPLWLYIQVRIGGRTLGQWRRSVDTLA
jgi:GNAT superfamily N-acetyltransferase